ncbi:zf-HC2 domain-containing protein [Actinocrispum sp. NPDC049592]|uniref:zf-HC2 domain-containing protein n=1 Tax=Actinocrispum sp. NPDC049592 TaxID=3154835 RepID=UPI003444E4D2
MECGTCTEALSARLDGETEPVPAAEVDEHLAICPKCQAWYADATLLTRRVRVRPVTPTPDLVGAVLAEAKPRRRPVVRFALAGIGLLQLLLAVAQLFGTDVHNHAILTGHLIDEGVAWNLALGLAMLAAAWQPRRATGLLPAVAVFVAALAVFSIIDAATVGVPGTRVLSHLPLLVGVALLYLVQRRHKRDSDPAPTERQNTDFDHTAADFDDRRQERPSRPWLRPAGHRRAA